MLHKISEMNENDYKVTGLVSARLETFGDDHHNKHVAMIYENGIHYEIQHWF
jgi:hypothetical protein